MDLILKYAEPALIILGLVVTGATVIAPLTKNKVDDKAVGWLKKLHDLLSGFAVSFKKK